MRNKGNVVAALINGMSIDHIPVSDRGLHYGDGVFRTLPASGGKAFDLERHLEKLGHDATRLGISMPDAGLWQADISRFPQTTLQHGNLKLMLTRGQARRGYRPEPGNAPTRIVLAYPAAEYPDSHWIEGVPLDVCQTRMGHNPALAGIKHLNRLEQVLARSEPHVTIEGLMLDLNAQVISGTMSNLFLVRDNCLYTPALDQCGIRGLMRDVIIERAVASGIRVREAPLSLQDCLDADECFLSNSLIGIWPVRQLAGRHWQPGPLTRRLQTQIQHPRIPELLS